MIVGAVSGLPVDVLRPWCASARNVYLGPMYLLTDTPDAYGEIAVTYGVEPWYSALRTPEEGVCGIARTRWKALVHLLWTIEPQLPVVFADTRDVIFQSDPHALVDGLLIVGGEGKQHRENAWCLGWLKTLYPDEWRELLELEVLNAGVIGGPAGLLQQFANDMAAQIPVVPCTCESGANHMTDQTVLNHLLRREYGTRVQIRHDWVFHVRSQEHQRIPAAWHEDSKQLIRADGEPFPIVHQYDLAEQLAPVFQEMR